MKNRYVLHLDTSAGLWEVIDTATGYIKLSTPSASSAVAFAESLKAADDKAAAETPRLLALIARKLVLIPVLVSLGYFIIGLFFHWKDGSPAFPWLAISAGALLVLTILWGIISLIFNLTEGNSDDESSRSN